MNVHEYQAKNLFKEFQIPVPQGGLAITPREARSIAESMPGPVWVVKAQIHAGGRGKGGGVKVVHSPADVETAAAQILGMTLVTHQTGPQGKLVRKVWIEQGTEVSRELYLAVVLDRGAECLAVMASPDGGMDIEEVAAKTPERIFTTHVVPGQLLWPFQARKLLFGCGLEPKQVLSGAALIQNLVRLAWEKEATLVEINPLALTTDGRLVALDGKINFDESALKRHNDIAALEDPTETDPLERQAVDLGLNYIRLQGNVGTMVNGAGLAMATMDVIKQAGAEPANFLDVGGGASEEMVTKGFEVILSDPQVKAILINIFGGILRCDTLASGVVAAAKKVNLKVPLVVRLEGTNVEDGRRILAESGLNFEVAGSLSEAAAKIAQVTGGAQ
jgi:succinyl-CoA synthetase beta subunit